MSIAQSIIDIVASEKSKAGNGTVKEVELEIGKLAGIEYESLDFALNVMQKGSVIEGSKIVINRPPGEAICNDCSYRFIIESPVNSCPKCESYGCSIVGGRELKVVSILIE